MTAKPIIETVEVAVRRVPTDQAVEIHHAHRAVACGGYTFDQLADIYNQARVDYIVPMPMNGKRMQEYVQNYDINLDQSVVSLNGSGEETGIGMVGLRDDRAWITRLGVIPERRGKRLGQYLMEQMLANAAGCGARLVQLEVIVGNDPAYNLFRKLGFEDTRQLLIIRRPPGAPAPDPALDALTAAEIPSETIPQILNQREPGASWVEETRSLLNAGNLRGLTTALPSGESGWIVFQRWPFQLTHLVMSAGLSNELGRALLYHLHKTFPMLDTKVENVPITHTNWQIFQAMGYLEVFRRTEMVLRLE